MAVKGSCVPLARLDRGALIATETRVGAVTVKVAAGDVTPLRLAVMDAAPGANAVAMPMEPALALKEATGGLDETQLTELVRSRFELSV